MSKKLRIQLFLLDNIIWVIVVVFFLINVIFAENFATKANIINIFYHSAIMSMLVLGQGLILISGNLDLSLESTLAFAPAVTMLLATSWIASGLNPFICIILTLTIGALVGLFNGFCVGKIKINPLLQTLSLLILLRGLVLFLLPFSIFQLPEAYTFLGKFRIFDIPIAIPFVIMIYIIFHIVLQYTRFGRCFMATGGNPDASFISGINTQRMIMYAFVISGLLAAVAGLLAAGRQDAVTNSMGDGMVLLAFAGAILGGASLHGGKGAPIGFFGGAILLGMFSNSLNLLGVTATLVQASKGALIFVAIVLDRMKVKIRNNLLHKEQAIKMLQEEEVSQSVTS